MLFRPAPTLFSGWFICLLFVGASALAAASSEEVMNLDHSFAAALNRASQSEVANWLDPEFTWTNRSGRTVAGNDFLSLLASLTTGADSDEQAMAAGSVVLVHGTHALPSQGVNVRFVRVWVKRLAGWRLLIYQETTKAEKDPEKRGGFGAPANGAPVNCENPCKTVPYQPADPAAEEVVSMWQAVERTVLTNDVEGWIPNFTEDFLFVTPDGGTPLNKQGRIGMIKELRRTNTTLIPARVLSMQVWVFGDAAVMRSEHQPLQGKIQHVTRLFEKHAGHWQIAFGQQTWVE